MDSRRQLTFRSLGFGRGIHRLAGRGGSPVLALTALLLLGVPVTARETAPDVATGGETDVVYLFVQTFASGTWQPKDGEEGVFVLTLNDIGAETIYFSDRPARQVGLIPTGEFLDSLGFTAANPPNAALATETESGEREVLVVELFAPAYDAAAGTLTYDAVLLAEYGEAALADLAQHATGELLPPSFGGGHLFIDSCYEDFGCIPI